MSYEAVYDPLNVTVPNVVTAWNEVDLPTRNPNTINNPNTDQVNGIVILDACKFDGVSSIVPFTAQDQTNWAAAQATALNLAERAAGESDVTSPQDLGKLDRAVADVIIAQLNLHSTWEAALAAAVAAASSLANLQTRVAAITPVAQVTLAQAKTAITNEIAAGTEGD